MPETDVVVLGSGAAGLSAALTAGAGGAAVTVPGGGGTLGPAVTFGHVAAKSVLAEGGLSA